MAEFHLGVQVDGAYCPIGTRGYLDRAEARGFPPEVCGEPSRRRGTLLEGVRLVWHELDRI